MFVRLVILPLLSKIANSERSRVRFRELLQRREAEKLFTVAGRKVKSVFGYLFALTVLLNPDVRSLSGELRRETWRRFLRRLHRVVRVAPAKLAVRKSDP